jgi:transcriptional regulator with XRE-family HTH domain
MNTDILKQTRVARGLSQDQVAQKLGLTQQAYSVMENNPENVTLSRLREIAGILGVDVVTLIGEESAYYHTNLNQQGGNAATKLIIHTSTESDQELIKHLKDEVQYLRNVISSNKIQ